MSNLSIKIVAVEVTTVPTQKGSYQVAEVTYKNMTFEGKTETKKIMSFVHKDVFNTIKQAQGGETYTVARTKDDKGYWQWVQIAAGDVVLASEGGAAPAGAPATKAATPAPKSTFETPEERAKKQVYIVRQSSISAAIDTLKTDKKAPTVEEVLAVAKQYEAYVFDLNEAKPQAAKLPEMDEEDIPY
jgi:hypothetical protein